MEGRGSFADITRDPATGNWVLNGIKRGARTEPYTNTDFLFVHEFKLSQAHEALRGAFELNVSNLWNQDHVLLVAAGQPFRGFLSFPNPDPTLAANGIPDWNTVLTGYDYIARANAQRSLYDQRYGLPVLFQGPRSLRLKLKFSF